MAIFYSQVCLAYRFFISLRVKFIKLGICSYYLAYCTYYHVTIPMFV